MFFIGIGLVFAVGLALLISADAGSLIGLDQHQTGQLLPLMLILILVAGGAFTRRRRAAELLTDALLWVGIFGAALVGYSYRDGLSSVATRVMGELTPGAAIVSSEGGIASIRRSFGGSFRVNTEVNGVELPLIFDTGATAVVLSHEDAARAGLALDNLRYSVPVQTANGTGRAASVILDRVRVGEIVRGQVRAFVAEPGALETSLLGMTFLETLSEYRVMRDILEMRD